MNPLERIQQHYEHALELPQDQRSAYLDNLEKDNPEQAAKVRELLAVESHQLTPDAGILDQPTHQGRRIGSYVLEKELGRGGMGQVWLANQEQPVKRKVAIKLMRFWGLDEVTQKRFDLERMALARMNHSCIAHFYEAAVTPEGQPYLVMEYLEGLPITQYAAQHKLDLQARLDLFAKVCAGVTHAHQRGVLHRDIKPGNIIVVTEDGSPVPKLIDFGIARSIEEQGFTQTGHTPGTWSYMSPEQVNPALGEQDIRTDIFSLGVTLYELLTGAPPLGANRSFTPNLGRDICEKVPERPSRVWQKMTREKQQKLSIEMNGNTGQLINELSRDLDWILMKTLEKDQDRRYRSVTELSDDLSRYAAGMPITAGSPGPFYVWRKFIARHKAMVAFTVSALTLVIMFSVVAIWQASVAKTERARALEEAQTSQAVLKFIQQSFRELDPYQDGGRFVTARAILDSASLRIDSELKDQPQVKVRMMSLLGDIYGSYGALDEGGHMLHAALDLQTLNPDPDHEAEILASLATIEMENMNQDAAEEMARRALAIRRQNEDSDSPKIGMALITLAEVRNKDSKHDLALNLVSEAIEIFKKNGDKRHIAIGLELSGQIKQFVGDLDGATADVEKGLSLLAYDEKHTGLIASLIHTKAMISSSRGDFDEAIQLYEKASTLDKKIFGEDSLHLLVAKSNIAHALVEKGNLSEAEAIYRELHTVLKRTLGEDHPQNAHVFSPLGHILSLRGQHQEAETMLLKALSIFQEIYGENHIRTAAVQQFLGILYATLKDKRAVQHMEAAYNTRKLIYGEKHPNTVTTAYTLAYQSWMLGDIQKAEMRFAKLIPAMEAVHGAPSNHLAAALSHYASFSNEQGLVERAIDLFQQSIKMRRQLKQHEHPRLGLTLMRLASVHNKLGEYTKAEPLAKEGFAIIKTSFPDDPARIAKAEQILLESQAK